MKCQECGCRKWSVTLWSPKFFYLTTRGHDGDNETRRHAYESLRNSQRKRSDVLDASNNAIETDNVRLWGNKERERDGDGAWEETRLFLRSTWGQMLERHTHKFVRRVVNSAEG